MGLCGRCQSLQVRAYPPSAVRADDTRMIVGATTLDGERLAFDRQRAERLEDSVLLPAIAPARVEEDAVVGTLNGAPRTVPLGDLRDVRIEERRFSPGRTVALVGAGVGALVVLAAAAVSASGPYFPTVEP